MKNRFNLNEEEKNRIRGLHGINIITEQEVDDEIITEDMMADMDASEIDLESVSEKQEDWMGSDWDDLDENIQNAYRQHEEFKGLDEAGIREKFNSMGVRPLCKIARFLFGWIVLLGRSAMDKELSARS